MLPSWAPFGGDDDPESARERLLERLRAREGVDERVLEAMGAVPRHRFVPEGRRGEAYADRPLPIGAGQTVSAPHMVARMADLLAPAPDDRLLEIGTGCGYHAAVTAELLAEGALYSVEYHESLAAGARDRLAELGYEVAIRVGDGREGWPEHAPYDGAYLTCAPAELPPAIVEQVREGGRIVAPVGRDRQRLVRVVAGADGVAERTTHGGVRFVSME